MFDERVKNATIQIYQKTMRNTNNRLNKKDHRRTRKSRMRNTYCIIRHGKTFDRVSQAGVFIAMERLGVSKKLRVRMHTPYKHKRLT